MAAATSAESQKKSNRIIIIIGAVIIALLIGVIVYLLTRPADMSIGEGDVPLGYAVDAKVMLDEDALRAAMEEAQRNAREGRIALRYQNNAYSDDGKTFTCLIANSSANAFDMFIALYADEELTDQLFLSGLVPPGSGFDEITLDHALPSGNNTVYAVLTQVTTDEEGNQMLKNQVAHTIQFHVSE